MKKYLIGFCALLVAVNMALAADLSINDLIGKIKGNQEKIRDLYAETTTSISANMALPGKKGSGPQNMTQKGKLWNKGKDKTRVEMTSPMRQITITNGDKMAVINQDSGQKVVQDMKKLREKSGQPDSSKQMDLEKMTEYFDLSIKRVGDDYLIIGIPKEKSKFLGKMEFYVDPSRWVTDRILMYGPGDKLLSRSDIEYKEFAGVWIPVKNISSVTTPAGNMKMTMEFSGIKVNQGIDDSVFKVE